MGGMPRECTAVTIELRVSQDKLRAAAMAWPKEEAGRLTEEVVFAQLELLGVVHGINPKSISEFVEGVNTTELLDQAFVQIVVQGEPALDGIDGRILWTNDTQREVAGTIMPGGDIDFRERGSFVEVTADDVIAIVVAPTDPVPGRDIYGTELPAKKAKKVSLKAGAGARSLNAGAEIRATKTGVLRVEQNRVFVDELLRIRGNVDFSIGNIKGTGSVHVTGDVLPGFEVQANNNVLVDGSVEAGVVESGGSVLIRQGAFRGSRLYAEGEISIGHIRDAYCQAGGDIVIQREAYNSTINTKKNLLVKDGPSGARLAGGIARALGTIQVGNAGTADGVITKLEVGHDPDIEIKRMRLEIELAQVEDRLKQLTRLTKLAAASTVSKPQAASHFKQMRKLHSAERVRIETALDKLQGAAFTGDVLNSDTGEKRLPAHISIKQTVFPGVSIRVRDGVTNILEQTAGGRFWYDRNEDKLKFTA
jgi:uncharacterized protein (DUF342 family)